MCGLTLCITVADTAGVPTGHGACGSDDSHGHVPNGHSSDSHSHGSGSGSDSSNDDTFPRLLSSLHAENDKRGPDASGVYATRVPSSASCGGAAGADLLITLGSSVLGLRGTLTPQPLVGVRGVLAWNGQVFSGLHPDETQGQRDLAPDLEIPVDENDTRRLFALIEAGARPEDVFASVEGPFAYVYYEYATATIHFGVDPLSRRSLLLHVPDTAADHSQQPSPPNWFVLTSARSATARELGLSMRALDGGATGLLDLRAVRVDSSNNTVDYSSALTMWTRSPLRPVNPALPTTTGTAVAEAECPRFVAHLTEAVRRRVVNIPPGPPGSARVALLFSGGVDCSLLAAVVHRCLPPGEPIELVNVAFAQPGGGGKGGGKGSGQVGRKSAGKGKGKDKRKGDAARPTGDPQDGSNQETPASASASTSKPASTSPPSPAPSPSPSPSPAASAPAPASVRDTTYDVPDRRSGLDAAAELARACPGREFRFVAVDIDVDTARAARSVVVDVMYPSNTEMDLSLAYPLFFASRGVGVLRTFTNAEGEDEKSGDGAGGGYEEYRASAKVYLSGLGADEQLAGYTRHRRAFDRGAHTGLIEELQLDLDRLPQRNLSRDDRVLSTHARDARYPYLDIAFVDYVSALPIAAKCDMSLPPGQGDKLLIRLAARACGLEVTAGRVKRAMQFGTKSAKLNEAGSRGHRVGEGLITECV